MLKVLVINGPNLNLLGTREPEIYGHDTLDDINAGLAALAESLGCELDFFQSNSEEAIIHQIQIAPEGFDGLVINPAAFTHTSLAIADALAAVAVPTVEVHLSNIYAREEFRRKSFISPVAVGVIAGFGRMSYELALRGLLTKLNQGSASGGKG